MYRTTVIYQYHGNTYYWAGGQTTVNYIGNYDYYIEKKDALTAAALAGKPADSLPPFLTAQKNAQKESAKADWKQSKEEQALLKRKKWAEKNRERITVIEDRLKAIEEESALPEVCTDTARLLELHKESTKLSEELDTLYEKWEELSE